MDLDVKKNAFVQLGQFLSQFSNQELVIEHANAKEEELYNELANLS